MDAFEQLAADIFWNEGYWVRTSVKVELTREDKARIQSPSSPRWELDVVAYSPSRNELLALECKSYLDSGGVHAAHFQSGSKYAHRYKLFHDDVLRETVLGRLQLQFASCGLCRPDTAVRIGLIHAHATEYNAALLQELFAREGWLLYGPAWLHGHLNRMAGGSYENSVAAVVAKLLLRRKSAA
jgi:hypothetical protein